MNAILGGAAVAPVLRSPSVRAEQVTQLVMGEAAAITERTGDWLRVETLTERYPGWIHRGYVVEVSLPEAEAWHGAAAWCDGAVITLDEGPVPVPLRGRVMLEEDSVRLPGGRTGRIASGLVADLDFVRESAAKVRADEWVLRRFRGAPYQWGGVTPWGVDCSALVQAAWLAAGVVLPRDAAEQAACGSEVAPAAIAPGDLLFFADGDTPDKVNHVAIAGPRDTMVHATLRRGGFVVEPRGALESLMARLVTVRRVSRGAP